MLENIIEGIWSIPRVIIDFIDNVCHLITAFLLITYNVLTGAPSVKKGGTYRRKKELSQTKSSQIKSSHTKSRKR